MKNFSVVCSALFALSMSAESFAQTHGSHYNPPSGGGGSSHSSGSSSSGSSSSSSHGSSYNPPSHSSSSSSSSSHGSSYNPPSHSSSSSSSSHGSSYNPPSHSSSSSSSSHGSSYNPPSSSGSSSSGSYSPSHGSSSSTPTYSAPARGPRYNPPGSIGNPTTPRGPRYNPPVSHTPVVVVHGAHYNNPRDYYTSVPTYYIYHSWVQYPVYYWYTDGYWDIDGYPYYVNRGYRYRYNPVDLCQYELVDASTYTTVKTYPLQACTTAYDQCAVERDTMNRTIGLEKYFCAEAVDKDLAASDTTSYRGSAVEMTDAKKAEIAAYLTDMDFKAIYKDGSNGGVGTCSVLKVGGLFGNSNEYNCKFQINDGTKGYPAVDGSVCSDSARAELVGCNVGSEKENAGCILKQAIESGYCL